MCGIAGIIMKDGSVHNDQLNAMAKAMAHRGPDGFGIWSRGAFGFVHTRLAIIDLESGDQPLFSPDGSALIGNGEIYNYKELCETDATRAKTFPTKSDFAPVLDLLERVGAPSLSLLRGMFALAFLKHDENRVLLARDYFGIKPLYIVETKDCYAFASEPQVFVKSGLIKPEINLRARDELLIRAFSSGTDTIFKHIYRVPAGGVLSISPQGIEWLPKLDALTPPPDLPSNPDDFDQQFERSVELHQRADVEFGLFLSGGIDSSTILAMMSRLNKKPTVAITARFDIDGSVDESETASATAKYFNADHHVVTVTAEKVWQHLPEIIAACDDPTNDYALVPCWFLAQKARALGLKLVLCGEGGDEMLGGYGRYRRAMRPWWMGGRDHNPDRLMSDFGFKIKTEQQKMPTEKFWSKLQKLQVRDMRYWMVDDLLLKVDRMLMAHGVEGRTPYIDPIFSRYNFYLPDNAKIKNKLGKFISRKWLHDHAPNFPHASRKQGFTVPIGAWLMNERTRIDEILLRQPCLIGIGGANTLNMALEQKSDNAGLLRWRLLFYAVWFKAHIDGTMPRQNQSLWDYMA